MCKVIAVSSYKGGVAKTTSAVSIGIEMAHLGKKVLLIDIDAQGDLTKSLGIGNPEKLDLILEQLPLFLIVETQDQDVVVQHSHVCGAFGCVQVYKSEVIVIKIACAILQITIDHIQQDEDAGDVLLFADTFYSVFQSGETYVFQSS